MSQVEDYEYVLVGSGVAATTVAQCLLQANAATSILMLEAGPQIPTRDRRYWWDYVISKTAPYEQPCYDQEGDNKSVGATSWDSMGSRMMAYGGSTGHWGGWSLRYRPEDFDLFSNTGYGGDWPYGYDTLEPYYGRAESLLNVCGDDNNPPRSTPYPLPPYPYRASDGEMIEAFKRKDLSFAPMPLARARRCLTTGTCKYCPVGARFAGSQPLDDILANPRYVNFKFLGSTPVTRLLVGDSRQKIEGVEFRDADSGELRSATGQRIIMCGGAYEVPKLLMLSKGKNVWKQGVGNDTDLVGRYPVAHRFITVSGTRPTNPERWISEYDFPSLMSRAYDTPKLQKRGKIFMMKSTQAPDTDIAKLMIEGKSREQIDAILTGPRKVLLSAFMEDLGQWKNRFTPGTGTTRFGLPTTVIDYASPPKFMKNAQKNLKLMSKIVKEMGYQVDALSVEDSQTGYHTCSTARMGLQEEDGVVDADLKVMGTSNLYVCSNAALPNCAAVNPTLTLVAIALKLGDHLVSRA